MSAIDKTPINKNFLSPLGFKFSIQKLPHTNFFVQKANIPGLKFGSIPEQANPFVSIPLTGDHLLYNEFTITFRVDEDMMNYLEIHRWIRGLGFPDNQNEYSAIADEDRFLGGGIKSEASLIITTNGKNPNIECVYNDAFPISLSDITFDTTDDSVSYIEATATFRYTKYEISYL
jgi:hypothetical protein